MSTDYNTHIFQYAGTITGCISSILFYPIDTYKSRLQASHFSKKGLYKGILPETISNTVSNLIYWSLYQHCRDKNHSPIQSVLLSSIVSNVVDSPLDYIKKHRQLGIQTPSFAWKPFINYCLLNSGYSCVYNVSYMYILSTYMQQERKNLSTLVWCSIVSSTVSYPIDYIRTCSVKKNNIYSFSSFMKGYSVRLLYSTFYSTCYMKCFLFLTGELI